VNNNVVKNCMYHCAVAEEEEEEKETEDHEASCLLDPYHGHTFL